MRLPLSIAIVATAGTLVLLPFAPASQVSADSTPNRTNSPTQLTHPPSTPSSRPPRAPSPSVTSPSVVSPLPQAGSAGWYQEGANLPWFNWSCDFGCADQGGVSNSEVRRALASRFAQAQANGIQVVRWWAFEGDPWQITRTPDGAPLTVDPGVYSDFDAALGLADTYNLRFVFVLFSSPKDLPIAWLTDASQRLRLATALRPLFERYRTNQRVLSWEIFNEPEFDIWNGLVPQVPVQQTVRLLADTIHTSSSATVTVGSAMLDGLPMWVGQGLDYYQAHWYDYMDGGDWCAICTDYPSVRSRYNLDAPLVIGELYAGPDVDVLGRLNYFYNAGYSGTLPWSLFPDHTNDGMVIDLAAAQTFANQHPDIRPRAMSSSNAGSTPQPARRP